MITMGLYEDKALLEKKLGISLSDDDKSIIATLSATNRFADVISTVYIYVSSSSNIDYVESGYSELVNSRLRSAGNSGQRLVG